MEINYNHPQVTASLKLLADYLNSFINREEEHETFDLSVTDLRQDIVKIYDIETSDHYLLVILLEGDCPNTLSVWFEDIDSLKIVKAVYEVETNIDDIPLKEEE